LCTSWRLPPIRHFHRLRPLVCSDVALWNFIFVLWRTRVITIDGPKLVAEVAECNGIGLWIRRVYAFGGACVDTHRIGGEVEELIEVGAGLDFDVVEGRVDV